MTDTKKSKASAWIAGVLVFVVFLVIVSGFVLSAVGLVWWAMVTIGSTPAVFALAGLSILVSGIGLLVLLAKLARWATRGGDS